MLIQTSFPGLRQRMHAQAAYDAERGAATAELAVLLPLMFVLVLGGIDFGRALYELTVVANAATAGAKYGAHDATHSGNYAGMEDAALDDLRNSLAVEDVSVAADRYCVCDDGTAIDCFTGTCAGGPGERRSYVRVRIEKPFTTLFPYPGVPASVLLSREAQMRVQ
jgi:Flp pilus assembly protein TadG